MTLAQAKLHEIIDKLTDTDISQVIDFVEYLRIKKEKQVYKDLQQVSESSMEFWNNDIDNQVWNDV